MSSVYLPHFALVLARDIELLAFRRTFEGPCEGLIPDRIRTSRYNLYRKFVRHGATTWQDERLK